MFSIAVCPNPLPSRQICQYAETAGFPTLALPFKTKISLSPTSQEAVFSRITFKAVHLAVFAVFQLLGPQPNHAGIAQLQFVTALDEDLHSLFTPLFADFTFHESLFTAVRASLSSKLRSSWPKFIILVVVIGFSIKV